MYRIALCIILFFAPFIQKAKAQSHYTEIRNIKGDLNKDGLSDIVKVLQDTIADTAPYRLQIFFGKPGKKYQLVLSSSTAIEPAYPEGRDGWRSGTEFYDVEIKNGVLIIRADELRGVYEHKFRYQKNKFELIGFYQVYSDGQGEMYTTDLNLSTGMRITKKERYDIEDPNSTDTRPVIKKEHFQFKTLPDLKTFTPFDADGIESL